MSVTQLHWVHWSCTSSPCKFSADGPASSVELLVELANHELATGHIVGIERCD